ncbi:MAG: hypothetical protein DMD69_17905 [Gemmatimonadetes bacterium]|nr:MAG: hypothetical protein DMD69_17905 [Gemmatimonadota bacterium]
MLPNKRAVIALKESSVSCPGGDGRFVHYPCADRRVARSLRAIRYAASLGAMPRFASAVVVGLLLGWAAAHALFLHWWTLVPWGLAALALGYRAGRGEAAIAGALYGFVLCFTFTLAGYGGAAPVVSRVPFFTLLGLVGALCGLVLALLGVLLRPTRRERAPSSSRDDVA